MIAGGGKRKGGSFERQIAKQLSLWITHGQSFDALQRSASSGAVTTIYRKKGKKAFESQIGDLAPSSAEGTWLCQHFAFELKAYGDLQVQNLIFNQPSKLGSFWKTHQELVVGTSKIPILIAKQNRKPPILLAPFWLKNQFMGQSAVTIESLQVAIFLLDEFLEKIDYEHFKQLMSAAIKD